jgi:hypothetical protein
MLLQNYRRLVRTSALYDLVATASFVTPWTFAITHRMLSSFSSLPPFEPLHVLFANLLGSIVVVWSVLRVLNPDPVYGLYDTFARFLFFTWQLYYLLVMSGASVVWLFAGPELMFGVLQAYGYWLLRKVQAGSPSTCRVVRHFSEAAA